MPVDAEQIGRMIRSLRHRGPDEDGAYVAGNIGLGHARLSILDLSGGRHRSATRTVPCGLHSTERSLTTSSCARI